MSRKVIGFLLSSTVLGRYLVTVRFYGHTEGAGLEVGFHAGLSFADYVGIPAANKSGLEHFEQSAFHYWFNNLRPNRVEKEKSLALRLGTGIHTMILEPEEFYKRTVVIPADAPKRPTSKQLEAAKPAPKTIAQIEYWKTFDEHAGDREQITIDQETAIKEIARNVRHHPVAGALFEKGAAELTMVWIDPIYRVKCKARLDWLSGFVPGETNAEEAAIVDFKSCEDASPRAFGKDAWNYEYHVQAAMYGDGFLALTGHFPPFLFFAVEKPEPRAVAAYWATDRHIQIGRMIYRRRLKQYAECLAAQKWPSYSNEITDLWLPDWAEKEGQREHRLASDTLEF